MAQQQQFKVESIGPLVRGIERRQRRLSAIRGKVDPKELPSLDLRITRLEKSRKILLGESVRCTKVEPAYAASYVAKNK